MTTFITQIKDEHHKIIIDKTVWLKEGLGVGDYVEVTIKKVEKTPKSQSGSPYSQ